MKKLSLLSLFVCLLVTGTFLWRRLGLDQIFLPTKTISPLTTTPKEFLLLEELERNGFKMTQTPIIDKDTIIASVSGIKVFFSSDQDAKFAVRALQLVLSRLKMEEKHFGEIDLRFGKVVLR